MAEEKKAGQRKSAAELKEQAQKARSEKTLDKIEEEAEGRATVEDAVDERREELRGGDAGERDATPATASPVGTDEERAAAVRANAEAAGHLLGPPGVGEEGGPEEVPVSVSEQINKQSYLEVGPDGRLYQVRQIRTDIQ